MGARYRSEDELREIAKGILENLRPEHLSVGQIKDVAKLIVEATDYIVLREKHDEDK